MFESFLYGYENANHILIQPVDERELMLIPKEAMLIQEISGMEDFALLALKVNSWNDDLSPWKAPAVYGSEDFGGEGQIFLDYAEELVKEEYPDKRIILGGYSLAGLFALWAATKTDLFCGIAAASPSVWYPGFTDYLQANPVKTSAVYLSLGNQEANTRNKITATVEKCLLQTHETLQKQEIACKLEYNDGNHFKEPDFRTAKAFSWVLRKTGNRPI